MCGSSCIGPRRVCCSATRASRRRVPVGGAAEDRAASEDRRRAARRDPGDGAGDRDPAVRRAGGAAEAAAVSRRRRGGSAELRRAAGSGCSEVREATEDTLFDLAEHLPNEAAEALLDLAVGATPRVAEEIEEHVDRVRAPGRAAAIPRHHERRGAGAGARVSRGSGGWCSSIRRSGSSSSGSTAARRASPARPAPARRSSHSIAPSISRGRTTTRGFC